MTNVLGMDKIKRVLTTESQEDECGLWFVVGLLKDEYPNESNEWIKNTTLSLLNEMLTNQLLHAVTIDYDNKYWVIWEGNVENILKKISKEWEERWNDLQGFDDIVWFVADINATDFKIIHQTIN